MTDLTRRVERLESQAVGAMPVFDCEKNARETAEALKRLCVIRNSMTEEEFEAYERERMENAPADSPLGRMRDMCAEKGYKL